MRKIKKEGIGTGGMGLIGLGAAATLIAGSPPWLPAVAITSGIGLWVYGIWHSHYSTLEKIFINCNLYSRTLNNTIILPKIIKKISKNNGEDVILSLPAGLCLDDFKIKEKHISQTLNTNVKFSYNNGVLIMSKNNSKLSNNYPFKLFEYDNPLKIAFAYDTNGVYCIDLEESLHTLIAGSTGAGKSVLLRSLITSVILSKKKQDILLHLVDFMKVELGIFKRSNMVESICTSAEQFSTLLDSLKCEADRRLELFEEKDVVNVKSWNKKYSKKRLPYILVVIDEFAALADSDNKPIMNKFKERCAQDRKCGIYYIVCTQRPSSDIISGSIKCNIPSRIALQLATDTDSQVVLDMNGAEKLKEKGRALVKINSQVDEVQVMYLSEEQAINMIKHTFVSKTNNKPKKVKGYIEI